LFDGKMAKNGIKFGVNLISLFQEKCTFFMLFALVFINYVPCGTNSQEFTYYSKPGDGNGNDADLETHVEDVNLITEYNETGPTSTALATVYPLPNITADEIPKDIRVACLNNTHETVVEVFNSTTALMSSLYINNDVRNSTTPSNCSMILFYARWCPFSAKAAPHFNALPRVFPSLKTAAIDATLHTSVNTYFGIISVPTVMLFRNGKLVAKFNQSTFTLPRFVDFISAITDLQVAEKVNVTSQDFSGPLPSAPIKELNLYLYLAWIFIGICCVNYARKSQVFKTLIEFVRNTWREAEAQHEHQE